MPARKTYGSNKSDPPQTSWVHGIISELCGNRVGGMLTPRVKNSGRVWRHGLRSSQQNENHGHSPWFSQGKWPGGYTIIYSRKFWVRLMRTLHSLGSHRSLAILECHSYSPRPLSHIFLWLLIYLCAPPLVFALTFLGPLQSPRSCIAGPRGRQFPSSVLQARQIFSTSLPPTQSLPLAFCVHFHVGPSLWRQPIPQSVWVICYIFFPSSPLQALGCKTAFEWDVLWLREKKGQLR